MFNIKRQLKKLYASSTFRFLSLTGAWVAIMSARGYSLVEVGFAETVFHIASFLFEIPSGVLADVFGRKKMMVVSAIMQMISNFIMIISNSLFLICLSMVFNALSWNFMSGSGEALAYDSLKSAGKTEEFEKYESNQSIIYRLCSGISTLCAGFALAIGHKAAYSVDLVSGLIQLSIISTITEMYAENTGKPKAQDVWKRIIGCFMESLSFLKKARKAVGLMFINSLVGACSILLIFFLQAKLPERGIPQWGLGIALLFMQMGGVVGSKYITKFKKVDYKWIFTVTTLMVLLGYLAEHSSLYWIMALGGFLATAGDDALQIRTNAILHDMFPSEQRATLVSLESFSFSAIMIVLSPIAGYIFTYW